MIDIVIPSGNEKALLAMARALGYEALCFLYGSSPVIRPEQGVLIGGLDRRIKGARILVCRAGMDSRKIIVRDRPDIMIGSESVVEHDSPSHRKSGLDNVILDLALERNVAIGFSVASVLSGGQRILGRVRQNISFCRKNGVRTAIASFAAKPEEMRAPQDIRSLFITLGMHPAEAARAIGLPAKLLKI